MWEILWHFMNRSYVARKSNSEGIYKSEQKNVKNLFLSQLILPNIKFLPRSNDFQCLCNTPKYPVSMLQPQWCMDSCNFSPLNLQILRSSSTKWEILFQYPMILRIKINNLKLSNIRKYEHLVHNRIELFFSHERAE